MLTQAECALQRSGTLIRHNSELIAYATMKHPEKELPASTGCVKRHNEEVPGAIQTAPGASEVGAALLLTLSVRCGQARSI